MCGKSVYDYLLIPYDLSMIPIRFKKCMIKLLKHVFFVFHYIPDWQVTQKFVTVLLEDSFMKIYYPGR